MKRKRSVSPEPSKAKTKKTKTPVVLPKDPPSKSPGKIRDIEDLEEDDAAIEGDPDSEIEEEIASNSSDEPTESLPTKSARPEEDLEGPGTRALSVTDPLRRYMEEVKRYPLLPPEEEFRLAQRMRDTGDLNAAKMLVSANLRLVVKISYEYRNYTTNLLDLIQEGNVGLMKAVSKFDPTKGARLGYYASWWIRSYILKYLLENFRLVRLGTTQSQKKLFYHLMREKERLEAQGLVAAPRLLADRLNVKEKDVIEMEQRLGHQGGEVSLDAPVDGGEGRSVSHVDLLMADEEQASDQLERSQLLKLLERRLPEFEKTLNERERKIFSDRLLSDEPKTLQEIAEVYGLTRERARQIEAKMLEKLRVFLKKDLRGTWNDGQDDEEGSDL
jgi:RNA polymerase sigma-32 factor